nr:hypothetical protein [Tanacetum cinerariifolium]
MDQNIDYSGFDQIQPPRYPEMSKEVFQAKGNLMKSIQTFLENFNRISFGKIPKVLLQAWEKYFAIQHAQPEDTNELFQKLLEDLHIINEELAEYINFSSWNRPTFYNNDEEHYEVKNIVEQPTKHGTRIVESLQNFRVKKSSTSLNNTSQISLVNAIAPILPTKEPEYSFSMGYEHLSTIPKTESDEVIESSVKKLVQIPSEYEVTSDDESECDVPIKDESSPDFTTFSNPIFDDNDYFTSSDDESLSNEDVPMENFTSYSNPLFDDEEINSDDIDPHYFNVESDLIESLSNRDTLFDSSPKFDYLEEISGELMPSSIINEERIKREYEEYISLMEISVMNNIDELNEDECFDPGGEIDVFANVEYDDYFPFIFVIRIFLPYLNFPEVFPLLLFTVSEDTIFDPGISV